MEDRLYNAVFNDLDGGFDPLKQHFSYIMDFSKEHSEGEGLKATVEKCIGGDGLFYNRYSFENITDGVVTEDIKVKATMLSYKQISVSYFAVFEYDDSDITNEISEFLVRMKAFGDSFMYDRLSVIVKVSGRQTEYLKALDKLSFKLEDKGRLYILDACERVGIGTVNENVCGIILINCNKEAARRLIVNYDNACHWCDSSYRDRDEKGRETIDKFNMNLWSTVLCSFINDRKSFMTYYMWLLLKNAKRLTSDYLFDFCDSYYSENIAPPDIAKYTAILTEAAENIPHIRNTCSGMDVSLDGYCGIYYGTNISERDILMLTFKANLKNEKVFDTETVRNAARYLFNSFSRFHTESLYKDIVDKLSEYVSDGIKIPTIDSVYSGTGSFKGLTSRYIGEYIKVLTAERKSFFWFDVLTYIKKHKDEFEEQINTSKEIFVRYEDMLSWYSRPNYVDNHDITVPELFADELANADSSFEICKDIREAYDSKKVSPELYTVHRSAVPFKEWFLKYPAFASDFSYTIKTEAFTVEVKQLIGRYFLFCN